MEIILIEDDKNINNIITSLLINYDILSFTNGESALKHINNNTNLVLVDLMLPGMSGQEIIKKIRSNNSGVKIFVITALNLEDVQIECLDLGVDDYITKPIGLKVLLKKVEILDSTLNCLKLDRDSMKVYINGHIYNLTRKEFDILEYLYQNSNRYVTREQIALHVWGNDFVGEYTIINTHIKNIRLKINGITIEASRNIGYKYVQ